MAAADLGARIETLKQHITLLRARAHAAEERASRGTGRLSAPAPVRVVGVAASSLKRHHKQLARSVLLPAIVRETLGCRALAARARAQVEAPPREERFRRICPIYTETVAAEPAPSLHCTQLQGLHWWVPILRADDRLPDSPGC